MQGRQKLQTVGALLLTMIILIQMIPCQPCLADDVFSSSGSQPKAAYIRGTGLSPGAREAATLLGILPKVERLIALRQSKTDDEAMSDEELALKVDVLDKVLGGTLEVRMVSDRIDRELAWAFNGQGMLQGRRQKILNYLFTANFMQGGILGIISGPLFLHGLPIAGTDMLLLASSIGLGLSTLSLIATRSPTKRIDGETTVLAHVFNIPHPDPPHRLDTIVKFMNSVPPECTDKKTRIETLMEGWKKGRYLRTTDEKHLKKLAAVQPEAHQYRENIRLISDRIRMLFDTQWTVQQLDGEMLDLMRAIDLN